MSLFSTFQSMICFCCVVEMGFQRKLTGLTLVFFACEISQMWPHLYTFTTSIKPTRFGQYQRWQTRAYTNNGNDKHTCATRTSFESFPLTHSHTLTAPLSSLFPSVFLSKPITRHARHVEFSPDDLYSSQTHPGFSSVLHSETVSYSFFTLCKNTAQKLDVSY